jgi:hypothetical protein
MAQRPPIDPAKALAGKIGSHVSWLNTEDRSARTAPARAALEARFLAEGGGDPVRAEHARKAFYARLAMKSAMSRRKASQLVATAEAAEAELAEAGGDPDAAA